MEKWQSLFIIPSLRTIPPVIIVQSFNTWAKQLDLVGISHQEQRQNTKPRSYSNTTEGNAKKTRKIESNHSRELSRFSQVGTWSLTEKPNHISPHLVRKLFLAKVSNSQLHHPYCSLVHAKPTHKNKPRITCIQIQDIHNSCLPLCFKFNTPHWPNQEPVFKTNLTRHSLKLRRPEPPAHWRRWRKCCRTTQLPVQKLYSWDPSSLHCVCLGTSLQLKRKLYAVTTRIKGYFPCLGEATGSPQTTGNTIQASCNI